MFRAKLGGELRNERLDFGGVGEHRLAARGSVALIGCEFVGAQHEVFGTRIDRLSIRFPDDVAEVETVGIFSLGFHS